MRSYQLESLQFFTNLYRNGIQGGILADEMVSRGLAVDQGGDGAWPPLLSPSGCGRDLLDSHLVFTVAVMVIGAWQNAADYRPAGSAQGIRDPSGDVGRRLPHVGAQVTKMTDTPEIPT